ncbi:uncharacterized protein LOC125647719 [Ostrea edulis]|uniref:uncharacterized protein LOC125647719 n=1 Tax=Ostrea edulis TaxID=37623 RepID=UPI0020953F65|nr:uncharacterized protein LOC125647719 [Ostrea edulis]XP_048730475.1 uncharacterized protein LOC125647719 [Ostrea edulis]
MLKYSVTSDEGSFSPNHIRHENSETLMKDTIDVNINPRSRAKMVMKKRAKHVQRRGGDFTIFPPISQTPSNHRNDVITPYVNHIDADSPYINSLGISRVHDVTTPYVFHSQFSKHDRTSPMPQKEFTRISNLRNNAGTPQNPPQQNVVEVTRIKKDQSFSHESINKLGGSSPFIERRSRLDHRRKMAKENMNHNTPRNHVQEGDKNAKLQIQSNQMGLVQRAERHKSFHDYSRARNEEQFSIRKKIEQFRKWHEEQYKDKLKKLKEEVDNQFDVENRRAQTSRVGSHTPQGNTKDRQEKKTKTELQQKSSSSGQTPVLNGGNVPSSVDEKASSERTWHTWRDINDSYAYTNVKQYIEENELMTTEKEDWIKKWVVEVDKAMKSEEQGPTQV